MAPWLAKFSILGSESLKSAFCKTFSPELKLSLESWISHCLCKNLPEYPPDMTIRTSILFNYTGFHGLKITNYLFSNSFPALLLQLPKQEVLLLTHIYCSHDEDGSHQQRTLLILLPVTQISTSSLESVIDSKKNHKYLTFKPGSFQNGGFQE